MQEEPRAERPVAKQQVLPSRTRQLFEDLAFAVLGLLAAAAVVAWVVQSAAH